MGKDEACEAIWEAAEEYVYQNLASPIDRPSQYSIDKMIEVKYWELLEELLEGAPN